jgi:molybdopterin synthase catalytic subunit
MNLQDLVERVKRHPDYPRVGMILCHNGVVRSTSRDGREVTGLRVSVDRSVLERILREHRLRDGIVDIQVEIAEDRDLAVGEDVMMLVVAGDIRENVISALADTLDAVKGEATSKIQHFRSPEP